MNQAERVLSLVRDLPRGAGSSDSTAAALAEKYDASERTIYRDIQLLQGAGYAISRGETGYYLLPTDRAASVQLTADQFEALTYAVQWVSETVPDSLAGRLRDVLGRLSATFGTSDAVRLSLNAEAAMAVKAPITDGPPAMWNMVTALRARRQRRKLRGVYHHPDRDDDTERVIHPYAIVYRGDAHYLVAFCELRGTERTFRLDRFRELELLDSEADIPPDFDVEEHFAGAWQVTGGRRRTVRIRVLGKTARRLRSQRVHESQRVLKRGSNELLLEFRVAITDEFRSWLIGLAPNVDVQSPTSLRNWMRETAEKILERCR